MKKKIGFRGLRAWISIATVSIMLFGSMQIVASLSSAPAMDDILVPPGATGSYVPGTEWVKSGVVLDIGGEGQETHVMTPTVLKLANGSYAMWYQGLGSDGHQRIYKATSNDGLSWTRCGLAINYGEPFAESGVMFPYVMVDDSGLYHMWYSGYDGYKHKKILHATSVDGSSWTKLGPELAYGSAFDPDGVSHPRVHFDGSQWHMWYSGSQWNPLRIWVCHAHKATLADPWIKDGIVLHNDAEYDNNVAWAQYILPNDNGYDMFYGGRSPNQYPGRICHASSADGLTWTKTGIVIDRTLPGESWMCDFPSVLVEGGVYRMWYAGYDGVNTRIFYAEPADPTPVEPAELTIQKVKLSGIDEGFTLTYYEWELLISVSNVGGSSAVDVVVRDVLPAELGLLGLVPSVGNASSVITNPGTRSVRPPPTIQPVRATHITWTISEIIPGETATLYMRICTRVNPGGNQEFTSLGTYSLNDGAWLAAIDALTGNPIAAGPTQPITVIISDPVLIVEPIFMNPCNGPKILCVNLRDFMV